MTEKVLALSLCNQVLSCERIEPEKLHVLWYDTERSEESTQDVLVNGIMPMAGLSAQNHAANERFDVFNAEVKASSPIRTSLYEREGSMWGSLKRPSPRRPSQSEAETARHRTAAPPG